MAIPSRVINLIEHFGRDIKAFRSGQYNETQVRREFIDPFFKALGWDVENEQGVPETYKDVIHEDQIKIGGQTKAPDYCFRVGGSRKFFLEAKKPVVNLDSDTKPAFQLRRYAWSANLPVSILTDFEEFVVYDCRIKPDKDDKATTARTLYIDYTQYYDRWDEIETLFHRDAVLAGSLDQYTVSLKDKKGVATVDDAFLGEIETWRRILAENIAERNPQLSKRDINYAVQMTIDRIIFLRICEDRGIEPYERLKGVLTNGSIYTKLCKIFQDADDRYNSGLFHFRKEKERPELPDDLTLDLVIDDEPFQRIIPNFYYPDSPYEFSVLPIEILGQVYEQFLGKVINLTTDHRATIDDKPEVRKAGGVYYTPTYVVDYIVKNTVGKLLDGKTPRQTTKLKILDPACGSGSFLIGAYQFLLDWHRDWYVNDGPEKHKKDLYQAISGEWRLTADTRKRVLLNNIYGVDIDPQAVEVTKLSLLLKVLEGESSQTLATQLRMFHERALPDLAQNIKCGNSLIASDFYDNQQLGFFDAEEQYRINVFDWEDEFSNILQDGGFDIVIGNPPWGAEFTEPELEYLRTHNKEVIVRMIDSFMYFVYQNSKRLKENGYFGMILPDVLLYQIDNAKLRKFILDGYEIDTTLNMGDVFNKVVRPSSVIIYKNHHSRNTNIKIGDFASVNKVMKAVALLDESHYDSIPQKEIYNIPSLLFVTANPSHYLIWTKVKSAAHDLLENIIDTDGIQRGVSPDLKQAFLVNTEVANTWALEKEKLRKSLTGGRQVKRYYIERPDLWLIYTSRADDFRRLPNICKYVEQHKNEITCKEVQQGKHPLYALHRPREEHIFTKPQKIVGVITEDEIIVALDSEQTFVTDGLYLFGLREPYDPRYVMGILNSRLFVFIYRLLAIEKGRVLAQVKPTTLSQLPIRTINPNNTQEKLLHDKICVSVDEISTLYINQTKAKTAQDKTLYNRQIIAATRRIDRLIYSLYNLNEQEIQLIEA
ncbi:hypothetical protein SE17_04535 [Kouleothrix aurantiaca]|uniref:site-specific DNA-methyltransferase (adenine-specific) n=1 Tax=Kouleothrix aurantiaca TaxID=186479 RepID=A0A0N8PT21_9CHLR|nr:hypothetical protein SE17_04535 [Kouleothrix aurantiaca]